MTITDRDGLSAVQIARINRIELARYQKPKSQTRNVPLIGLLVGIVLIICAMLVLVHNRWQPGTELYTRLPNLDAQTPSITIYAK